MNQYELYREAVKAKGRRRLAPSCSNPKFGKSLERLPDRLSRPRTRFGEVPPMSQVRTLQGFELYRKICWDYVNSRGHDLDTRFQQHFPKIKHPPGLNTWRVSFPRFFHPATLHAAPRSYSPARNFALPAGFELVDEQDREFRRSADHARGRKACAAGDGVH